MSKSDKLKKRLENIENIISKQISIYSDYSNSDSKFSRYLRQCEQGWTALKGLKDGLMPKYIRIIPSTNLTFESLENQIKSLLDKISNESLIFYTSHHDKEIEKKWMIYFLADLRQSQNTWKHLLIGCESMGIIVNSEIAKVDLIFAEGLQYQKIPLLEQLLRNNKVSSGKLITNLPKRNIAIEFLINETKVNDDYRLAGENFQ
jgi:hypothetical protein